MKTTFFILYALFSAMTQAADIAICSLPQNKEKEIPLFELCFFPLDDVLNKKLLEGTTTLCDYSTLKIPSVFIVRDGEKYHVFRVIYEKERYQFYPCDFIFDGISFHKIKEKTPFQGIVVDSVKIGIKS